MNKRNKVLEALKNKSLLKVIAGINNFNEEKVLSIASAAEKMSADSIDICAKADIVARVIEKCKNTAVFVSSVEVAELLEAEKLGADVLELGNYEALHAQNYFPSADEIYELAKEIIEQRSSALVSITVPGHLQIAEQVKLAQKLEELGVEIIQTEGASLVELSEQAQATNTLAQVEKVKLTLANTIELSKVLEKAYIITASGITPETVNMAYAAGAAGVGVGKFVNKLESSLEQAAAIASLKAKINKDAIMLEACLV